MSEAVGSDEIEDVLSSVRRLVSPEVRPRIVSRDVGQEKLLLTPALRVASDTPRAAPLILTERALDPGETAPQASLAQSGLDRMVAAGPEPVAFSAAAMASETQPETVIDVAQNVIILDAAPGRFDDLLTADPAPFAPVLDSAEAPEAMPETTLHVVDGVWEDALWSEAEPALAELALGVEEAELVTQVPAAEHDLAFVSAHAPDDKTVLDAPAEASPAEAAEPAPSAQPEAASPTVDAAQAPTSPADAEQLANVTDAKENTVPVLDEAALSDIVRALIREELQGVLGERITQNVRKLVRSEINRALTARSLD